MISIPIWVIVLFVYCAVAGYLYAIGETDGTTLPLLQAIFWPGVIPAAILLGLFKGFW